ncbi:IgGFc-binding protein-like [Mercenaria mercenaria]|uniref:IgGFc-binding protein-like n=1 Tax=Mercenaria mercenaria TaxID=6596 RepID=UPI00234F1AEA|nr:IgGFc-binding protein-like [Mercenaria mercenaria]
MDGKLVADMFPNWYLAMQQNRVVIDKPTFTSFDPWSSREYRARKDTIPVRDQSSSASTERSASRSPGARGPSRRPESRSPKRRGPRNHAPVRTSASDSNRNPPFKRPWNNQPNVNSSHYGTEFYLGVIPNVVTPNITIDIASEAQGTVQLHVPFLNLNRSERLNKGLTSLTIDHSLVKKGTFTQQRGIWIKTSTLVAVYVTSYVNHSPDTYMALPTISLGKTYMTGSFQPVDSSEKSEIMITSTFANTTIDVSSNGLVHLAEFDVTQIVDSSDLTGTIISATMPVTVISGTSCANIPPNIADCDFIVEQMFPVNAWTNIYIVPPIPPRTGYFARIQAMDEVQVFITNSSQQLYRHMLQKTFEQFQFGSEPTVIYSNGTLNFSVIQYGVGPGFDPQEGGPFMTVILGLKNYISSYIFVISPSYSNFENYLTVIIKASNKTGILLDGQPLPYMYNYTVSKPLDEYVVFVSHISTGFHNLTHIDKLVNFGALLYGFNSGSGYGYPAGMKYPGSDVAPSKTRNVINVTR